MGAPLAHLFANDGPDAPVATAHRQALEGKTVASLETTWLERTFHLHVEPLRCASGIVGCVGVGLDITDRKAAEESQEMFFRLFEFAPDAIVVVDEQGTIRQANVKAEHVFGYSRAELVGKPVRS